MTSGFPARWWHRSGSVVECDLCPNSCRLSTDGARGACGLRFREGAQLRTLGWGGAEVFHLDPVEKKPLYHFLPGSSTFSVGMTGCNLGCLHCQNWSLSMAREGAPLEHSLEPEEIARMAVRMGASSVSFTYNEPLISAEYWIEVARACREAGLKTVAVTNGYAQSEVCREFFSWMDAANVDLKGFTDRFYHQICKGRLAPVLQNLSSIRKLGSCHLEIATLLIPGRNDDREELEELVDWIKDHVGSQTPLHFTAFHPDHKALDWAATGAESLAKARELALERGLSYVYTGNIRDRAGSTTYCPNCAATLVVRDGFRLVADRIESDRCPDYGWKIAGVFGLRPVPQDSYG